MNRNHKSDFDFILSIENVDGFPNYDFDGFVHVVGHPFPRVQFSKRGGIIVNCYDDNGRIHVVCNKHKMMCGNIVVEYFAHLPNSIYPDQLQTLHTPIATDMYLVEGKGDEATPSEISVMLPYAVITDYDIAVAHGYTGTQEQYVEAIDKLPKSVKAAYNQPIIGANDNWWVWDPELEEYIDTGKPSHGSSITVVQEKGDSEEDVMSQKAVTNSLSEKVDAVEGMGLSSNDFTNQFKEIVSKTPAELGNRLKKQNKNDAEYTFTQFKGWLSDGATKKGQPSCCGIVKFAKHQCPILDANVVLQCNFIWLSEKQDGTDSNHGVCLLYPADFTSSNWGGVQRVNTAWKDPWMFTMDITKSDNSWSGNNNFTGNLKSNGNDVMRKRINLNEESVTIEQLDANKDYVFNAPVALLTINAVVDSVLETRLYLTTSTTIPVINIPDSIKRIGTWQFEPSTQYIVTFCYGTVKADKAV